MKTVRPGNVNKHERVRHPKQAKFMKKLASLTAFLKLRGANLDDDVSVQLTKVKFVGSLLVANKRPIGSFLSRDVTIRTRYGLFRCRKREDDLDIVYEGFERDVLEVFTPNIGETVVDCGAHVGKYSVLASKLVGGDGKVIAFEPCLATYQLLQMNLKLNDCGNVMATNCAVWNKSEERTLWLSSRSSIHSLNPLLGKSTRVGSTTVKCVKLDEIMKSMEKIDWLKLDVEGADLEALQGASKSIGEGKIGNIIVEASVPATLDFLKDAGYSLTQLLPSRYYYAHR